MGRRMMVIVALLSLGLQSGCASLQWRTREVPQGVQHEPQAARAEGEAEIVVDRDDEIIVAVDVVRHQDTRHHERIEVVRERKYTGGALASLPWFGLGAGAIGGGAALRGAEQKTDVEVVSESITSAGPVMDDVVWHYESSEPGPQDRLAAGLVVTGAVLATVGTIQLLSPLLPPAEREVGERTLDLPTTTQREPLSHTRVTVHLGGGGIVGSADTDEEGRARIPLALPLKGIVARELHFEVAGLGLVRGAQLDIGGTRAHRRWSAQRVASALARTEPDFDQARQFALAGGDEARSSWCAGVEHPFAAAVRAGDSRAAVALIRHTGGWTECRTLWDGSRAGARRHGDQALRDEDLDEAAAWLRYLGEDPGAAAEYDRLAERIDALEQRLEAEAVERAARTLEDQRRGWKGRARRAFGACDTFVVEIRRRQAELERLARSFDDRAYEAQEETSQWLAEQQDGPFGEALEELNTIMMEMEAQESDGFDTRQMRYELARQTEARCQP